MALQPLRRPAENHLMGEQRSPFLGLRDISVRPADQFMPAIRPADQPGIPKPVDDPGGVDDAFSEVF